MNNRYESSGVSIKEGDSFVEILKEQSNYSKK